MGLCMFGADNCKASVLQPGTQLGIAGGLAKGSAYRTAHLAPAGVKIFHYTRFQNGPKHSTAKKTVLKALFCLLCFEYT